MGSAACVWSWVLLMFCDRAMRFGDDRLIKRHGRGMNNAYSLVLPSSLYIASHLGCLSSVAIRSILAVHVHEFVLVLFYKSKRGPPLEEVVLWMLMAKFA